MTEVTAMADIETNLCFFCPTELTSEALCRMCQRPYCVEHTSPIDKSLCVECVNTSNTSITSEPLVTAEGVTKQNARKLVLSGEAWMRNKKLICNMTDIELDSYISAHTEAVHEMEIRTDYFRISLTEATHEKAERYNKKTRARSERTKLLGAVAKVHNVSGATLKEKTESVSKVMGSLTKLGLSKEQIAAILVNLVKNKPK
jgi:hypothetical protein